MLNDLTGFPVLREGTLRAAPFQGVPALLARFDVRPAGPCRDAGIPVALLSDPEGVISIEQAGRLLASCVRHTGCVPFGLLLGESFSLDTLGPIGALARGARDVGAGVANERSKAPAEARAVVVCHGLFRSMALSGEAGGPDQAARSRCSR